MVDPLARHVSRCSPYYKLFIYIKNKKTFTNTFRLTPVLGARQEYDRVRTNWLSIRIMCLSAIQIDGANSNSLIFQWGNTIKSPMTAHCHKSVPTLIKPLILPGSKTPTTNQPDTVPYQGCKVKSHPRPTSTKSIKITTPP